jgi:hypothetical protein
MVPARRSVSDIKRELEASRRNASDLAERLAKATVASAGAYQERYQLLRLLSLVYPSHLTPRPRRSGDWLVCIHSPSGVIAWPLWRRELAGFGHLERLDESHWDGDAEDRDSVLEALTKSTK